jgi:DNA-binding IclR family transcriptional regulator
MNVDTAPDAQHSSMTAAPDACRGRGVLVGAFAVLDALAHADDGLGLTALAGASGLAKTSTYRLAEQLVALGAVQCIEHRYYIGALIGRIGQRWQPDPFLRRAAQGPVHNLSVRAGAMASLRILHEERLRLICATAARGQAYISDPADRELVARTATGRVLYAAQDRGDVALPDCWPRREWRRLTESVREPGATVTDRQDAFPGICCVSAPVWSPDGTCAGAVTVLVLSPTLPPRLPDLVSHAAGHVGTALASSTQ